VSALRVSSGPPDAHGCTVSVTPQSAGWRYVGFEVLKLDGRIERHEDALETCVVLLSGSCSLLGLGEAARASVFDGPPTALYVPPRTPWWVEGAGEIAVCTAPAEGRLEPRLLAAPELTTRGSGTEERLIANILMESEEAESLLVTEVITPAGHWSSFPPHRHDRDAPPDEALLEETYYHRLRDTSAFAFQRVYTDDRSLDEGIVVNDGDVVLVPRGYHPVAGAARSDLYYLNVMAGPVRAWRVAGDPAYD
jgi:5-deoxy-glucuronate isomerase